MNKPDVIIITGAPGSGKSTLARLLDERLYSYTHIDPDDILQSFWEHNEKNPDYDREEVGVPKMEKILLDLLNNEVRLILEGQHDEGFLGRIKKNHSLLNIHCVAENTAERFYKRELLPDGTEPDWLGGHMEEINRLEKIAKDPVDVGQKIIEVDCTSNYKPSIENIIKELGADDV